MNVYVYFKTVSVFFFKICIYELDGDGKMVMRKGWLTERWKSDARKGVRLCWDGMGDR